MIAKEKEVLQTPPRKVNEEGKAKVPLIERIPESSPRKHIFKNTKNAFSSLIVMTEPTHPSKLASFASDTDKEFYQTQQEEKDDKKCLIF